MTYTCKHCGQQVPALTICNCRGALIEHYLEELDQHGWAGLRELTAENERLKEKIAAAGYRPDTGLLEIQKSKQALDAMVEYQAAEMKVLLPENERLTAELTAVRAELAECRQAAFENGRETERAAGYGELEY